MTKLSSGIEFRIKWAGPNSPMILLNNHRFSCTKADLKAMRREFDSFINFYIEDFASDRINLTDAEERDYD